MPALPRHPGFPRPADISRDCLVGSTASRLEPTYERSRPFEGRINASNPSRHAHRRTLAGVIWLSIASVLTLATPAFAADQDLCVADIAGLRDALTTWSLASQGSKITIRLVRGSYPVDNASGQTLGAFQSSGNASIQLLGGYTAGCVERVLDPRNTVIDGRNEPNSRLHLASVDGDALLEGLTFTRLNAGVQAIHRSDIPATGHAFRIRHSRLVGNTAVDIGGGSYTLRLWGFGLSSGATVAIENTLIAGNTNTAVTTPVVLSTGNNGTIRLTNSTIARNAGPFGSSAIQLQTWNGVSGLAFDVANNIVWGNASPGLGRDIDVSEAPSPPAITYTIAGTIAGSIQPTDTNLGIDPRFVDAASGNFRLSASSPAVDSGSSAQPGGVPDQDLEGQPRILGNGIDRGAYETVPGDLIFFDGMDH